MCSAPSPPCFRTPPCAGVRWRAGGASLQPGAGCCRGRACHCRRIFYRPREPGILEQRCACRCPADSRGGIPLVQHCACRYVCAPRLGADRRSTHRLGRCSWRGRVVCRRSASRRAAARPRGADRARWRLPKSGPALPTTPSIPRSWELWWMRAPRTSRWPSRRGLPCPSRTGSASSLWRRTTSPRSRA